MISVLVIIAAILVMVVIPVIDYWPASKVWAAVYWERIKNYYADGSGGEKDGR